MLRVRQISVNVENDSKEIIIKKLANKLGVRKDCIKSWKVTKKSIDARNKSNVLFVYELDVEVLDESSILRKNSPDIAKVLIDDYVFTPTGKQKCINRPIVVGSGPSGLFCAYFLALNGYRPLVIERGNKMEDRIKDVEHFWNKNELNSESNVQFGEGGAGTFSDGKLNTLIKGSSKQKKVFEIFVENGAPKDILVSNYPHIGTDKLRTVIANLRNQIIKMGGEFKYNAKMTNIYTDSNSVKAIEINSDEIVETNVLVLAIGHSARDTFQILNNYLKMKPKPFAIGIRIQHSQKEINKNQYGSKCANLLPPANYKLTYKTKAGRGVYSFCMCPGGFVVNASSELEHLAINGMSNYKRDEENANSALVVTISPSDYGNDIFDGLEFQRMLERRAYEVGKGLIPVSLYKDYKNNVSSKSFGTIKPVFKGDFTLTNINDIFPDFINESLKEAIEYFGTKICNFDNDDAILAAVESRTSSPICIERNEHGVSNITGIYPCGEGAGYAGGITSAAVDGIKVFEYIASTYSNN